MSIIAVKIRMLLCCDSNTFAKKGKNTQENKNECRRKTNSNEKRDS